MTSYLRNFSRFLTCLLCGMFSLASVALTSDKTQAVRLASDTADFNDTTQQYVLTGNVKITKGSIVVTGSKAVVVIDPDGYQTISVIGNPEIVAKFSQQLEGENRQFIDGEGDLILYEEKNDNLFISGQAYTQRRQGMQWKDRLVADQIQYDLYTEKYNAVSKLLTKPTKSIRAPRVQESPRLTDTRIDK